MSPREVAKRGFWAVVLSGFGFALAIIGSCGCASDQGRLTVAPSVDVHRLAVCPECGYDLVARPDSNQAPQTED